MKGNSVECSFKYGEHKAYAVVEIENNIFITNEIEINSGNLSPINIGNVETIVKTGLFQNPVWNYDLGDAFSDPEGDKLTLSIDENDYEDVVKLENSILTVNCDGIGDATIIITATDSFGAESRMTFKLTEDNVTKRYIIFALIAVAIIAAIVIMLLVRKSNLKCSLEITIDAFDDNDNWERMIM